MLHLARLGRRDMGEFGEAVEHHGDAEIAQRHHRRLPDAEILGVDQAEERQDRAREREGRGLLELAFDDEHGDGAQNDAGERRAAAERLQALVQDAGIAELVEADRGRVGAGGAERAVDHGFAPGGDLRNHRQNDRRRMAPRRFLEGLRADQHADVEQDRQDRDDGDQARDQGHDAEPGQHQHHHAGRGGIADPPAHRLPAGMADVDGVDERIAEQATDQADHAVGRQHLGRRERVRRPQTALSTLSIASTRS